MPAKKKGGSPGGAAPTFALSQSAAHEAALHALGHPAAVRTTHPNRLPAADAARRDVMGPVLNIDDGRFRRRDESSACRRGRSRADGGSGTDREGSGESDF